MQATDLEFGEIISIKKYDMGMNLGLNALAHVLTGGWVTLKGHRRSRRQDDPQPSTEALEPRQLLTTFTVTTPSDDSTVADSVLSLREAIAAANANPGADIIRISPALNGQTIGLTQGQLNITDPVTIIGQGAANTVIDGQLGSRVFSLSDTADDVTIDGVTIKNGRTEDEGAAGAGILSLSYGTLTVKNSSVNANATFGNYAQGGGIYSSAGPVVVINSTISGNTTSGNYAVGGGISTNTGSITLINSTVSNNVTAGANSSGGGIGTFGGSINLTNVTVYQNATLGTFASGGGVFSGAMSNQAISSMTINNSIVAQNVSNHSLNMDISKNNGVSTFNVNNSIIGVNNGTGLNQAPLGDPDANGNLVGTFTDKLDPKLGPLAYNGGQTKTHALLSNSPAIDMGNNSLALSPLSTTLTGDQGGQVRIFHSTVDIGSYELQTVPAAPSASFSTSTLSVGEGAGIITLTVNLSRSAVQDITIPFTLSGTAASQVDYTASTSSILIPAGATAGTITLTILDNPAVAANKTLLVTLGTPTNAVLGSIKTQTLTIVDTQNGGPSNFTLTAQTVSENTTNAPAGTLSATDPTSTSLVYSIQPGGQGSLFTIVGNQLKVGTTGLDYESLTNGVATVTIRVTNGIGAFLDKTFNINVKDLNEAPSIAAGQTLTVATKATYGTVVGNVVATDPDITANFKRLTYSIVSGNSNKAFTIDAATGQITVITSSALGTAGQKFTLMVKVTDGGSPALQFTQAVTVKVITPFVMKLSGSVGRIVTSPSAPVPLDSKAQLTGVDPNTSLSAARITVSETAGMSTRDTLLVRTGGSVTVKNSIISVNGVVVGHTTGGLNGLPLTISFTAGTKDIINTVLAQVSIVTTKTTSTQSLRTIKFLVSAGGFSTSTQMTARVS